ncbi:MAG TPA: 6,7-dimethyl-8-ribityllumazine synthase [Bacteroidota bacterium]|nr:6,7-dimethyl-8-ribityllumazine synthase [Bacteroidota bacterium]
MGRTIEGGYGAVPDKIGIVVSRFNEFITRRLLDGAVDCLRRHGVDDGNIDVVWCPGAFEIPQVARRLAAAPGYRVIICLGCVIRGETPHFGYVAGAVASGLEKLSMESDVPVIFGVLTTDTLEQAIDRAGAKSGNKGRDAAMSALEMADLFRKIPGKRK